MNKIAFAAALAASLFTVPAAAESVTVNYADLNVATPVGAQILAQRFDAAVDTACVRPDLRDIKAMAQFNACKDTAVASATQQLNDAGALTGASKLALN